MKDFPEYPKAWKKGIKRLAIVYPNKKQGGVYNLAMHIIYNLVNSQKDWVCEQRFLENANDLHNFDLIGFTWQYELDLNNILNILKSNKINGKTFAGGPCVNQNPNLIKNHVDFIIQGECEEALPKILKNYKELKGIHYVENKSFPKYPLYQPMPEKMDASYVFGKPFILEIERGCPFKCHFCPMPSKFKIKYRSLNQIKEIIDQGLKLNKRKKVIIYSPSFTHPQKKEILQYLVEKRISFSVPSIKSEYMDKETLNLICRGGQRSLTIAPECGETLRPSLNKKVKDETYLRFIEFANKFKSLKFYFMLGLPDQDKKDLDEILKLIVQSRKIFQGKIYASFNPFVPKKGTYFENQPFRKKEIKEQIKYLKKEIKVKAKFASVSTAEKVYMSAIS